MELTERVESINRQLVDLFGIDTLTGIPIWRVVWSEDQLEKRLMNSTDGGIYLLVPEVRQVPKYRQWIQNKYVLERLTIVPEVNADQIPEQKLSYEPVWVFETKDGKYLPPRLDAAKFVIDTMYAALGKSSLAKYKDSEENTTPEGREHRIEKLEKELFADETDTGDALAHGEAIVVPRSYES